MQQAQKALVVPTLNAGAAWRSWLAALKRQTLKPDVMIVIDSSSDDDTVEFAREYGFQVEIIARKEFNHGTTRQYTIELIPNVEIVVFLTQDAILADARALENLVRALDDPSVGVSYGRQLPHKDATPIAAHARLYNYPSNSRLKSAKDIPELGLKTAFCSNSMAAYRKSALLRCGGFPSETIVNEDMYVAAKMLLGGWKVAYCADAQVYHSHNYTYVEEFSRYFDQGVFHARQPWLKKEFGSVEGEGFMFVFSEFRYIGARHIHLIPNIIIRTALNYLGYKLGKLEKHLSLALKRRLSMHSHYWG
ncbi:MAG: glycosyltransferase [Pseudomonadota bacterium]